MSTDPTWEQIEGIKAIWIGQRCGGMTGSGEKPGTCRIVMGSVVDVEVLSAQEYFLIVELPDKSRKRIRVGPDFEFTDVTDGVEL